jgi:ABC-type transporter Mla subunit MlaD
MTKSDESQSFTIPTMDELLKLINALNPAENGAKVVDQAKRSIESVMASLQLILQSLENFNRVANRVDKLLDDVEDPIRKIADSSTLLTDLANNLAPLMAFLPQQKDPDRTTENS